MQLNHLFNIRPESESLKVNKERIIDLLGYDSQQPEKMVINLLDDYIEKSIKLFRPKGGYIIAKVDDIDINNGILKLNMIDFQVNKMIAAQLKNTEHIAAFVCTIGNKLELLSTELMKKNDNLEGYILSLIGSEAAEDFADIIHEQIKQVAEQNSLYITNRFSLGYCNWDVKEQFKLFKLFPESCCNISLTPSALMNPVKSVSGIVGIGEKVKFRPYSCSKCNDLNCLYRNKKK